MSVFDEYESNVRSYCRAFPATFKSGRGELLFAEDGRRFIDFFSGAGALNYGHNNKHIKNAVLEYLGGDGVLHALDMHTTAKRAFIEAFVDRRLKPRGLNYKLQFCGPTGTNAGEAALKIARKVTGRTGVFSFTGAFHGMSLGSLAATSNRGSRGGAGTTLPSVTFMPYPAGFGVPVDSIAYIEAILNDSHSGVDKPAAIIVETVQAEGGVNVAPAEWLQQLSDLCKRHDILLICDEIQVGCFRTGPFFSFERAKIVPDIVVLSKSISGIGFPMSLLLMKPELDIWRPGEHTGTFRGNQIAFVSARAALEFADNVDLQKTVNKAGALVQDFLHREIASLDARIRIRGLGLIWGIDLVDIGPVDTANSVSRHCFANGLIVETVGRNDTVVKLLPPLTIEHAALLEGCRILRDAVAGVLGTKLPRAS
jgi:diaminobutyrate-2-oxoglutarate transaminase